MFISQAGHVCLCALLISGVATDWEILNESREPAAPDLGLVEEHLLPALPVGKSRHGLSAVSHGQSGSKRASDEPDLQLQQNQTWVPERAPDTRPGLRLATAQDSPVGRADNTADTKREDFIDLAGEGLLLADSERGQPSRGRPQDGGQMSQVKPGPDIVPGVQEIRKTSQEKMSADAGTGVATDKVAAVSLKVACIQESSWECQMFKEHFLAMQGGHMKLSHRASVYERSKRQASSNYKNVAMDASNWNSRNLLGCEDGDCFSGDGDDTDANLVAPHFTFQSSTTVTTASNLTRQTLTSTQRQQLARDLENQLKPIFTNIPGFKCVRVNPKNVYIDSNGLLHLDNWEVTIDGGNGSYTGSSADNVTGQVEVAIRDANLQYKNIDIEGQHPIDDFNATKAVEDVRKQAIEPCNIYPSPCPCGYGHCQQQPLNLANSTGIRLRCTDNCLNYSDCNNHGQCRKDNASNAYCSCTGSWIGPYCDKENTTISDRDNIMSPVYTVSQKSEFNTSLTSDDLTPEKRQEIAKQLTEELKNNFATFPGLKDIVINPKDITVVNGVLVVPWNMTIDSGNPAYSGKNAEQIADVVRDNLQNLGDSYRNNVTVDGRHPINDLDFVNAAQQVEKQARDPCSSNSCPLGYNMCEALNATEIKCFHNCNSRATECQNAGQCQLDSAGNAVCQCADGYTGADCETEDSSLDAGQIAGVVAGSALLMGAVAGTAGMMAMGARRKQDVEFTEYTEEPSSDPVSYPSDMRFFLDRPAVYSSPMPIYGQAAGPNAGNNNTPSSYANNSGGENAPVNSPA